jgi:hypothetical protein
MSHEATTLDARIGSLALYATPAVLRAHFRSDAERVVRTALVLLASWLVAPLAFLVPPHAEPPVVVLLAGLYFARRAWVGQWVVEEMRGSCPRCSAAIELKHGTVLYLPHSLTCGACRVECWLEVGLAPEVEEAVRLEAIERTRAEPRAPLGGRPPLTWSPAASDWRDRRRD